MVWGGKRLQHKEIAIGDGGGGGGGVKKEGARKQIDIGAHDDKMYNIWCTLFVQAMLFPFNHVLGGSFNSALYIYIPLMYRNDLVSSVTNTGTHTGGREPRAPPPPLFKISTSIIIRTIVATKGCASVKIFSKVYSSCQNIGHCFLVGGGNRWFPPLLEKSCIKHCRLSVSISTLYGGRELGYSK